MTRSINSIDTNGNPLVRMLTDQEETNLVSLVSKARTALTNNTTYLGIGSPTQAQAIAQVGALTRQVDAIIRYLLGDLSTITDT